MLLDHLIQFGRNFDLAVIPVLLPNLKNLLYRNKVVFHNFERFAKWDEANEFPDNFLFKFDILVFFGLD